MAPPSHDRALRRERIVAGMMMGAFALGLAGCLAGESGLIPFARSAAPASLALNVHLARVPPGPSAPASVRATSPAGAGPATATHAQVASLPGGTAFILVEIGDRGGADFMEERFAVQPFPGLVQEAVVGNISPGLARRTFIAAADAQGRILDSALFLLDYLPGQVTSNDAQLGVPGGGTSVDGGGGGGGGGSALLFSEGFNAAPGNFDFCSSPSGNDPIIDSAPGHFSEGIAGVAFGSSTLAPPISALQTNSFTVNAPVSQTLRIEADVQINPTLGKSSVIFGLRDSGTCSPGSFFAGSLLAVVLETPSTGPTFLGLIKNTSPLGSVLVSVTGFHSIKLDILPDGGVDVYFDGNLQSGLSQGAGTVSGITGAKVYARGTGNAPLYFDNLRVELQ